MHEAALCACLDFPPVHEAGKLQKVHNSLRNLNWRSNAWKATCHCSCQTRILVFMLPTVHGRKKEEHDKLPVQTHLSSVSGFQHYVLGKPLTKSLPQSLRRILDHILGEILNTCRILAGPVGPPTPCETIVQPKRLPPPPQCSPVALLYRDDW